MDLGQFTFPADDPGLFVTASQIRQSTFDPALGPVPNMVYDSVGNPVAYTDVGAGDTLTITGHATPMWPLWIALGIMGWALFQGGKHY